MQFQGDSTFFSVIPRRTGSRYGVGRQSSMPTQDFIVLLLWVTERQTYNCIWKKHQFSLGREKQLKGDNLGFISSNLGNGSSVQGVWTILRQRAVRGLQSISELAARGVWINSECILIYINVCWVRISNRDAHDFFSCNIIFCVTFLHSFFMIFGSWRFLLFLHFVILALVPHMIF